MIYDYETNYPIMSINELKCFYLLLQQHDIKNDFLTDYILSGRNILFSMYDYDNNLSYLEHREKELDELIKVYRKNRSVYNFLHLISYAYFPSTTKKDKFKIIKPLPYDYIAYFD